MSRHGKKRKNQPHNEYWHGGGYKTTPPAETEKTETDGGNVDYTNRSGMAKASDRAAYKSAWKPVKPCHENPTALNLGEAYPGTLFLGNKASGSLAMARLDVDVLVPLDSASPHIWEIGWRGELLYCPVEDWGALPLDVLRWVVGTIIERLQDGLNVGLFCIGGHGRTGYIAAAIAGLTLPGLDPIEYVRASYCKQAVESREQVESLAAFLGQADLVSKHKNIGGARGGYGGYYDNGYTDSYRDRYGYKGRDYDAKKEDAQTEMVEASEESRLDGVSKWGVNGYVGTDGQYHLYDDTLDEDVIQHSEDIINTDEPKHVSAYLNDVRRFHEGG